MSEERAFLHDIASPLGTALFATDSLMAEIQELPENEQKYLQQLKMIYKSLQKTKTLLDERRQTLIAKKED